MIQIARNREILMWWFPVKTW